MAPTKTAGLPTADTEVRKQSAKELAEGYSTGKRAMDIFSCVAFMFLFFSNVITVARYYVHGENVSGKQLLMAPVAVLIALLGGDLFSGIAHWGLDTWGSVETPVFGAFIRSFREHHVDQMSITRHDTIETNGDNCLATLPLLAIQYFFMPIIPNTIFYSPEFHAFLVIFMAAIAVTNQIHKWSHQYKPAPFPKFLMDSGIILGARAHRVHHSGDFSHSYCITTGWLNPPLDAIGFWRHLENLITAVTGAIPRANDKALLGDAK